MSISNRSKRYPYIITINKFNRFIFRERKNLIVSRKHRFYLLFVFIYKNFK